MKLYLVGTPIGNLEDISPRAVRILGEVDFIAAEDTRVTGGLLHHLGIKKPMVSYYQHNLRERGVQIVDRILGGESCALVSDAGMPAISDPGEDLIRLCAQQGVPVESVPGPSALVTALALSGLPTGRFTFEGFLSVQTGARRKHLQELAQERRTMIFYEAPHKLRATLADFLVTFGAEREIAVVKELTKIHETVLRFPLSAAVDYFGENNPRGEYVLVLSGAPEPLESERLPIEVAVERVRARGAAGESLSAAAKAVAGETGWRRSDLYRLAVKEEN